MAGYRLTHETTWRYIAREDIEADQLIGA